MAKGEAETAVADVGLAGNQTFVACANSKTSRLKQTTHLNRQTLRMTAASFDATSRVTTLRTSSFLLFFVGGDVLWFIVRVFPMNV